jgi:NADH-quinone oxidoreductase subunit F
MLQTREDLVRLRRDCMLETEGEKKKILVCTGTACISGGALDIHAKLIDLMKERGLPCTVEMTGGTHEGAVRVTKAGCPGFCEIGPLVRIEPQGWLYTRVKVSDCEEIVDRTMVKGELIERLCYRQEGQIYPTKDSMPFYKKQRRVVLEHCGEIDSDSILDYLGTGGYSAFEKALFAMDGDEIVRQISDSNLRGRGGGGFPVGRKWGQVRRQSATPKYVVCNGDEGDPGAFMDRSVMEDDPHRMIEGMMIAGVACGASEGYLYVRAEYPVAVKKLRHAIEEAEAIGLLGDNILGSGFSFHLHLSRGAGAFVCGEGSALTASIEGKRGMPRVKPPRTVEQGLFGKPTVLNNVETFANVPEIILRGAEWFKSIGPENSPGTKAFSLTGNIVNNGLIEVPMGTTLREVI